MPFTVEQKLLQHYKSVFESLKVQHLRDRVFYCLCRYEGTIRAQFFGHTHSDEFAVFYKNANYSQRVTNMYYVAPSVTTYPVSSSKFAANPAYRIYIIDGDYTNSTRRVLNHETYFLNLTEANAKNITQWRLEYDAKVNHFNV